MNDYQKSTSKGLNDEKVINDIQATSDEASRLLADLEISSSNKYSNMQKSSSQRIKVGPHQPYKYPSNRTELSVSPWERIGGIFSILIVSLFILIPLINSTNSSSPSGSNLSTSTSIPFGKARYRSGRAGKVELIGVTLSIETNSNGHIAYEALWEDGYKSSYVFWRSGRADIFSRNGAGIIERTNARFKRVSNGDCIITTDTNAVTTFPRFTPTLN